MVTEKGDQPVRWIACVKAQEIIKYASDFLVMESHPNKKVDPFTDEHFVNQIERLARDMRFNLKNSEWPIKMT